MAWNRHPIAAAITAPDSNTQSSHQYDWPKRAQPLMKGPRRME
ncbi:hypothetical protein RESH_02463 [Rhodopirellula europaea SH398]|uniref:Uncharacterized protein n=1 Tax=Rhodopirellula europaea SH398 TaxID=1263868 RepID=M5S658_9BACT|nr:hypothetical protein RESH_02463 [Rhodopirellula europaea SH398]